MKPRWLTTSSFSILNKKTVIELDCPNCYGNDVILCTIRVSVECVNNTTSLSYHFSTHKLFSMSIIDVISPSMQAWHVPFFFSSSINFLPHNTSCSNSPTGFTHQYHDLTIRVAQLHLMQAPLPHPSHHDARSLKVSASCSHLLFLYPRHSYISSH